MFPLWAGVSISGMQGCVSDSFLGACRCSQILLHCTKGKGFGLTIGKSAPVAYGNMIVIC